MALLCNYLSWCCLVFLVHASTISFDGQGLTKIPQVSVQIPNDTVSLSVCDNSIRNTTSLDFQGLSNLKILKIEYNLLDAFPYLIYVSETLEELYLAHNQITEIKYEELDVLARLTHLKLDSNLLRSLPDCHGPSGSLQQLYLSHNLMEDLPSLNNLGKSLLYLEISYNQLKGVSVENTQGLDSIKYFLLYGNQLARFPDVTHISDSLVHIDLSDNMISDVPESHFLFTAPYYQVLVINLEDNLIRSLPYPGCGTQNLHVRLQGNPLHCDDRVAWLLASTGVRYVYYDNTFQDYYFNESLTDVQYYNTLEHVTCETPASLQGRILSELSYTELGISSDQSEGLTFESMSSRIQSDIYLMGLPLSMSQVFNHVECQALCAVTAGCHFYNYRAGLSGEESSLCHYSDPLNGREQQSAGGQGWTVYSSN